MVTGDIVYGANHQLRKRLQTRGTHYVLAVPRNHAVMIPTAVVLGVESRAAEAIAALDARAWRQRTAGAGTKGDRRYAWARQQINGLADDGEH